MSTLFLIWLASLWLAGLALLVMLALIIARAFSSRRTQKRQAAKRELVSQLLGGDKSGIANLAQVPPELLTDTFGDLFRLVRGEERNAFVAQASELGVPEQLARKARRGSPRQRVAAVRALANFHDPVVTETLHFALKDRDENVRLSAALALARSGGVPAIHELVEALQFGSRENSMLMVTLFRTLADRRPEDIKAFASQVEGASAARLSAIEALAATGDYSMVPLIVDLAVQAPDGSEDLPRLLRALGSLGHPGARPAVLRGLASGDFGARAAAATVAGRIGMTEAIPRLAELLDDAEWWVRFRAGEGLVRLRPEGIDALRSAAQGGSSRAAEAAGTVLAENGWQL